MILLLLPTCTTGGQWQVGSAYVQTCSLSLCSFCWKLYIIFFSSCISLRIGSVMLSLHTENNSLQRRVCVSNSTSDPLAMRK